MSTRYLSVDLVADYLGKTPAAIYMLVHRRRIPFTRLGRSLVFDKLEIDQFLARKAVKAAGPKPKGYEHGANETNEAA